MSMLRQPGRDDMGVVAAAMPGGGEDVGNRGVTEYSDHR